MAIGKVLTLLQMMSPWGKGVKKLNNTIIVMIIKRQPEKETVNILSLFSLYSPQKKNLIFFASNY